MLMEDKIIRMLNNMLTLFLLEGFNIGFDLTFPKICFVRSYKCNRGHSISTLGRGKGREVKPICMFVL